MPRHACCRWVTDATRGRFEIFECFRKIAIVGLPVFFRAGSSSQRMFVLTICFLTFGMYGVYSPYIEYSNVFLMLMTQVTIFISILSSSVLDNAPEDPFLSAALPALLVAPIVLAVIFAACHDHLRNISNVEKRSSISICKFRRAP